MMHFPIHSLRRFLKSLVAFAVLSVAAVAGASPFAPQNGAEYLTLQQPQPTEPGPKVEVIEFFGYFCPHCYKFEPFLSDWVKRNKDKVVFKRIHVNFHDLVTQQKLYFTLEAMNKADEFQQKVFDAVHVLNNQLATDNDVAAFVSKSGLDKKKFFDIYNSFSVQSKVNRVAKQQEQYHVDGVPQLIIDGRYVTSPVIAGASLGRNAPEGMSQKAALQVLDFLVDRVAKSKNNGVAAPAASAKAPAAAPVSKKKK